ncbi:hypothetical protein QYF36_015528 [Acer negundo]|nr:hypothetical protein QYF36_015528 [Acer negundo]
MKREKGEAFHWWVVVMSGGLSNFRSGFGYNSSLSQSSGRDSAMDYVQTFFEKWREEEGFTIDRKRRKINGGTTSKPPYFGLKNFFLVFFSVAKQNSGVILALPTLVSTSAGFSFLFRFTGKESHPIMWLQQMPFNPSTDDYRHTPCGTAVFSLKTIRLQVAAYVPPQMTIKVTGKCLSIDNHKVIGYRRCISTDHYKACTHAALVMCFIAMTFLYRSKTIRGVEMGQGSLKSHIEKKRANRQEKRTFVAYRDHQMATFGGTQQKCMACAKTVYLVDKLTADNRTYHKACFRCHHCRGTLKLSNYNSFEGVLYCRPHYDQLFKRTGSLDKSFEGTPKIVKPEKQTDNENAQKVSNLFAGTRDKCVCCKKTVYPIEKVSVNGCAYHRSCFKCTYGGCTISPSNYIAHEGKLYCKHHHIQLFKEKGNYSQLEDHEKIDNHMPPMEIATES